MIRLVVATLAASLILPTAYAEAGSSHRHKHYRHHGHAKHYRHYGYRDDGYGVWNAPVFMRRQPGPPWSGPNRCWQDLGYGRYESCDR